MEAFQQVHFLMVHIGRAQRSLQIVSHTGELLGRVAGATYKDKDRPAMRRDRERTNGSLPQSAIPPVTVRERK